MEAAEMEYIEGRLDRLGAAIDDKLRGQSCEIKDLISNNDVRYQQRFEAQGKELVESTKPTVNSDLE